MNNVEVISFPPERRDGHCFLEAFPSAASEDVASRSTEILATCSRFIAHGQAG